MLVACGCRHVFLHRCRHRFRGSGFRFRLGLRRNLFDGRFREYFFHDFFCFFGLGRCHDGAGRSQHFLEAWRFADFVRIGLELLEFDLEGLLVGNDFFGGGLFCLRLLLEHDIINVVQIVFIERGFDLYRRRCVFHRGWFCRLRSRVIIRDDLANRREDFLHRRFFVRFIGHSQPLDIPCGTNPYALTATGIVLTSIYRC